MNDINEHEFPNGGWAFRQPQTGFVNPMNMVGFRASVESIVKHRLANPAITAKHQLATDYNAVAEELKTYTRLRLGIPLPAPPSFFHHSSSLSSRVVAAAADIKRAAQGTAVLVDWLSSGGQPVEQALADKRAAICATCPKNVEGDWYTVAPATLIKETLEARKDLKLETPSDAQLKSCDVCKCLLRLKCWVPLQYITAHTKPEVMAEFPSHCWIYKRDK
jgi:hypothetical protein